MLVNEVVGNVRVSGRYTVKDEALYLAGSAAYIEFTTKSRTVSVKMISDGIPEDETLRAWAAVFINGEEKPSLRFGLQKGEHSYKIYDAVQTEEQDAEVTIRIMKYSEQAFASMGIVAVESENVIVPTANQKKRRIEFVGDSITCGYGIEGIVEKDSFTTAQENPWNAYACRTARLLDADFELLCWSGNGMISHYIAPDVDERRVEKPFIPEMYPYADRELEERDTGKELTLWKSDREPDLVVINIGTNDSSYTRNMPERNAFFQETYCSFVRQVREAHPDADILCVIGIMEQCVHECIAELVQQLRSEGEKKVHFLKMPLQDPEDGMATDYHPSPVTHKKAAALAAEFIRNIWNSQGQE